MRNICIYIVVLFSIIGCKSSGSTFNNEPSIIKQQLLASSDKLDGITLEAVYFFFATTDIASWVKLHTDGTYRYTDFNGWGPEVPDIVGTYQIKNNRLTFSDESFFKKRDVKNLFIITSENDISDIDGVIENKEDEEKKHYLFVEYR